MAMTCFNWPRSAPTLVSQWEFKRRQILSLGAAWEQSKACVVAALRSLTALSRDTRKGAGRSHAPSSAGTLPRVPDTHLLRQRDRDRGRVLQRARGAGHGDDNGLGSRRRR